MWISTQYLSKYNFTAEHAEDRIGLKTLRPLRSAFGAASQTAVIKPSDF